MSFWALLLVVVVLPCCQQQINFPKPVLNSLDPNTIQAGHPVFRLTAIGKQFSPGSLVLWNGTALSTIFVDTEHLTTQVPAALVQNPGSASVQAFTQTPGGGTTTTLTFTISPAPSNVPTITSATPSSVPAGSPGAQIQLTGTNFVSQSEVTVNGVNRTPFVVNSTSLSLSLTSSDVAKAGTVEIVVVNPAAPPPSPPNGGASNPFPLQVVNPFPTIKSITPTGVLAGGTTDTALTVTGTGFTSTSAVLINGGARTTTFVSSTSVTAQITPADQASAGIDQVQVFNSAPGGGTSNIVGLAINPTTTLGLPEILDLAADGTQAANGICGTVATCATGTPNVDTAGPSTGNNGKTIVFASISSNLVPNDTNGLSDIFVRTTCLGTASCTPTTVLVSTDTNGNAANGSSSEPTTDGGGVNVAFTSTATNMVTTAALTGTTRQVFWRPAALTTAVTTQLVSMAADGVSPGNGDSFSPMISPDSRYVAFVSLATNLVSNVNLDGVTPQVFVRDTCSGVTTTTCAPTTFLVSTADGTTPGNGPSSSPSISSGALFVSFISRATNLGATAPNPGGLAQAFVRSCPITATTCAPGTILASTADGVTPGNGAATQSAISSTGEFVAFTSTATNLGANSGGVQEVYVRDTCQGVGTTCVPSTSLISTRDGTTPANSLAEQPSFSTTGQFVAFASAASNLGANTANGIENVFVRNTCVTITTACTESTIVASQPAGTLAPASNGSSLAPSVSPDGHTVSFLSFAGNMVARDTNGVLDAFLASTTF